MKRQFLKILLPTLCVFSSASIAQTQMPLYVGQIPNAKGAENLEYTKANDDVDSLTFNVSVPSLRVYMPAVKIKKATAVIICPGGGYHVLLTKREGSDVAQAFNSLGVIAFVLKYRLPSDRTMSDRSVGPLQDVQQAIKIVRQNAAKWDIDPGKIGIIGFSAGGHLASSAGTHFEKAVVENPENISLRPDFMLLINPVISFNSQIVHTGSRNNLLGKLPDNEKVTFFSNELHISASTPPTWLVHSSEDKVVPFENSLVFYKALINKKVAAELHLYARGEHGFLTGPDFNEWFGRGVYWMKTMNFL